MGAPQTHAETLERLVPDLNDRQRRVLKEVCDAFISTGIPVGSRTISRFSSLSCSPATIRNEMADLESMGYLFSPHTSAGRIPTEKGYRFYVNFLLEYKRLGQLENAVMALLDSRIESRSREQEVLRTAIKVACEQTGLPGLVLAPHKSGNAVRNIQIVRVLETTAMLVMVDECGHITDHLVAIPAETTDEDLQKLTLHLRAELTESRITDAEADFLRRSKDLLTRHNHLIAQLTDRVRTAISNPASDAIFLEGFVNFFDKPEFSDPEKMRKMISLLDKKEQLLQLMARSLESGDDIMVNIGSDSGLALTDLSVVTARYSGPNHSFGRIGLIGPLRMDYARVVATLGNISRALSDLLLLAVPASGHRTGSENL
ncbi:MAG TPA: heat-inducible transcriptional repressor HrcA [Candidatus Ozemobacteraceae bacterium]|nr:heat-inducible transcriptional repressor HrcA [Candidatus Ozemobacteraceae bacterium]